MVVKSKLVKYMASNLPIVATPSPPQFIKTVGAFRSFFLLHGSLSKAILKIVCLQLPIQVFKEWIDGLGFFFHVFKGWV